MRWKWIAPVLALMIFDGIAGWTQAAAKEMPVQYIDAADGKGMTLPQVLEAVDGRQVVYFGEYHDSQPAHDAELAVLQGLYARHGSKLVLSMEMFERDVQGVLDDYLSGRISEEAFLAASRPWENYEQAYRPLVEFAKAHHLPVLAANIPRRMAAAVAKTGDFSGVAPED